MNTRKRNQCDWKRDTAFFSTRMIMDNLTPHIEMRTEVIYLNQRSIELLVKL